MMSSYGVLVEPRGSKFTLLKSVFHAENFVCRLLWSILSDFGAVHFPNVCVTALNREKIAEIPYFGVQGRSRSSMMVPLKSSSAVLVSLRLSATVF